jgi:hypothetical protein
MSLNSTTRGCCGADADANANANAKLIEMIYHFVIYFIHQTRHAPYHDWGPKTTASN